MAHLGKRIWSRLLLWLLTLSGSGIKEKKKESLPFLARLAVASCVNYLHVLSSWTWKTTRDVTMPISALHCTVHLELRHVSHLTSQYDPDPQLDSTRSPPIVWLASVQSQRKVENKTCPSSTAN